MRCPVCGSTRVSRSRCMNSATVCLDCRFSSKDAAVWESARRITIASTNISIDDITGVNLHILPDTYVFRYRVEYNLRNGDTLLETFRSRDEQIRRYCAVTTAIDRFA